MCPTRLCHMCPTRLCYMYPTRLCHMTHPPVSHVSHPLVSHNPPACVTWFPFSLPQDRWNVIVSFLRWVYIYPCDTNCRWNPRPPLSQSTRMESCFGHDECPPCSRQRHLPRNARRWRYPLRDAVSDRFVRTEVAELPTIRQCDCTARTHPTTARWDTSTRSLQTQWQRRHPSTPPRRPHTLRHLPPTPLKNGVPSPTAAGAAAATSARLLRPLAATTLILSPPPAPLMRAFLIQLNPSLRTVTSV